MRGRIILYGAAALCILLGGFALLRGTKADTGGKEPSLLAVTRALNAGAFLEAKDLEWRGRLPSDPPDREKSAITEGSLKNLKIKDPAELAGAVLRASLPKGSLLSKDDYIRPGDSPFLAAVLRPGTRAVTIRVDDVTGSAGLLRPGNRVDVIVSGNLESGGTSKKGLPSAKTLLRNVRVIAVNRDVDPTAETRVEEETVKGKRDALKGTVTLEVTPGEVELIAVGRSIGVLSLSLRSLEDSGEDAAGRGGLTKANDIIPPSGAGAEVTTYYGTEQNTSQKK
jgi:pilus assembly protein CpaB